MPVNASYGFDGNLDKARVLPYFKAEKIIYLDRSVLQKPSSINNRIHF